MFVFKPNLDKDVPFIILMCAKYYLHNWVLWQLLQVCEKKRKNTKKCSEFVSNALFFELVYGLPSYIGISTVNLV